MISLAFLSAPRTVSFFLRAVRSVVVVKTLPHRQLLFEIDIVFVGQELAVWERFYNFDRPHGAHGGKTPYEALREKLS